jgi:hypothetical protein
MSTRQVCCAGNSNVFPLRAFVSATLKPKSKYVEAPVSPAGPLGIAKSAEIARHFTVTVPSAFFFEDDFQPGTKAGRGIVVPASPRAPTGTVMVNVDVEK